MTPGALCQKIKLQSLRLRVQANNLWTWTRNSLGVDPEACSPVGGETGLRAPRSYVFSVNVGF